MVSHVKQSFEDILQPNKTSWLDEPTRAGAIEKLKAMKVKVAFADWMFDDTQLDDQYMVRFNGQEIEVVQHRFMESLHKWMANLVAIQFVTLDNYGTGYVLP